MEDFTDKINENEENNFTEKDLPALFKFERALMSLFLYIIGGQRREIVVGMSIEVRYIVTFCKLTFYRM
jgi:hypothetical protein